MNLKIFTAQRISRTAEFKINRAVEDVFPLFDAFEERKWAAGWDPELIYPATEIMKEGTTFRTAEPGYEEYYLWIVSKYQPENWLVQYLVSTDNRFWTISVQCIPEMQNQTAVTVTYCYTGLNEMGNNLNRLALDKMYKDDLKDWQEAINYYLETGKILS